MGFGVRVGLNRKGSFGVLSLLLGSSVILSGCDSKQDPESRLAQLEREIRQLRSELGMKRHASEIAVSGDHGPVVSVVERVMPSVVSIHSERAVRVTEQRYFNPFEDLYRFFGGSEDQRRNPPRQRAPGTEQYQQQGLGSGVVVAEGGVVVTNHHVIDGADRIRVTLSDNRVLQAELVGSDRMSDVAVLRIKNPPEDLPIASMGDSEALRVGETVIAIGNPFGYSNTVTRGIISARSRVMGINLYENYLQTDASINPGNSGGALIDLGGRVIGINTAIASRTGANHGIGFAIPINMAREIMNDLLDKGRVTRGYLGVMLQELEPGLVASMNLPSNQGALIGEVSKGSPADRGGLKSGDVIVAVNGNKVENVNDARNRVAMVEPGSRAEFEIIRNGSSKRLRVRLGSRDDLE